ncbi:protein FLX-like 1 isoform X2 [Telopea speciosissima]|uniref:protein FLX-like 1 isoform X2 n=1 Tax=Telopea speciosissima TaxID=54955 RepID=UPI001CC6B502|nr:protein FLX-like 1 isoform X2 [Telopea speciosissima]
MAGRNRLPHSLREVPYHGRPLPHPSLMEEPLPLHHRVPLSAGAGRPHPAIIEEHLVAQNREIQALLLDNQRLAATHVALKQDLVASQQELRHLSAAATNVKAGRDAEIREVYERSLKMESEIRSIDALNAELAQVRVDVQKLSAARHDLTAQLQAIDSDLARARADLQQAPAIKADIEYMRREIQRGRAAIEYEKKVHAENLEHGRAMEGNMASMAREAEKLRAELANAEKRARAAAAAGNPGPEFVGNYGNPDMGYGGSLYADPHGMHQVQGGVDAGPQYGSGAGIHGSYDIQRTHIHR